MITLEPYDDGIDLVAGCVALYRVQRDRFTIAILHCHGDHLIVEWRRDDWYGWPDSYEERTQHRIAPFNASPYAYAGRFWYVSGSTISSFEYLYDGLQIRDENYLARA
jgi:hypothetical protein